MTEERNNSAKHVYDEKYYQSVGGLTYSREEPHWLKFFGRIADRIIQDFHPKTVFDLGCAKGFLVEALRDRGVEAYGADISTYAIGQVREDLRQFCRVAPVTDPLDRDYDVITCIEVLEHVTEREAKNAIANMAARTSRIIFSSTPSDFDEPTHINVRPVLYWLELFADEGFYPDLTRDASFITSWAVCLKKDAVVSRSDLLSYVARVADLKMELVNQTQKAAQSGDPTFLDGNRVAVSTLFQRLVLRGVLRRTEHVALEVKRAVRRSGLVRVDPLLFCHLPKCGGTSFADIIKQEYRTSQRLFLYKVEELNYPEPSSEFLEHFRRIQHRVQVVYGHFKFGMHKCLGVPPCYASILREPVERVVSLYHHYERDPATSLEWHERIKAGLSLKEFATLARNHMTDLLSGSIDGSVDETMLERAKDNIRRHFVAIGTSDNMEDVLRVLSRRFSWRHHDIPTLNVRTQPHVQMDDETRATIADNNRLDAALYEWVKTTGTAEVAAKTMDAMRVAS